MRKCICVLLVMSGIISNSYAQCAIIQNLDDATKKTIDFRLGQTFRPCQDGYIESIKISTASPDFGTYELYLARASGANISGGPYQLFDATTEGTQNITLDIPFPVSDDVLYEFQVIKENRSVYSIKASFINPYVNGGCTVDGVEIQAFDTAFEVNIIGSNIIPTTSQWALLILGLSLTSLALVTIRKRILATA